MSRPVSSRSVGRCVTNVCPPLNNVERYDTRVRWSNGERTKEETGERRKASRSKGASGECLVHKRIREGQGARGLTIGLFVDQIQLKI